MVIPEFNEQPAEPEDVNLGTALTDPYQISTQTAFDGSTQELALICWLHEDTAIEDALFEAIRLKAEAYQALNAPAKEESSLPPATEESSASAVPEESSNPTSDESQAPEGSQTPENSQVPNDSQVPSDPVLPTAKEFFVVFKVTAGNMSLAEATTWQGMQVNYNEQKQS